MKKNFFLLILAFAGLFMAITTSCEKDPTAPVCDFTYETDGLTVSFISSSTDVKTYAWDFGDTETSIESNPIHSYAGGGEYIVKLTVTGDGGTDTKEVTINVESKPVIETLVSGAGYANDVYFSMENGVVKTQPRAEWNLAFSTYGQSISIHVNTGSKDSLFLWKGGAIADFNLAESLDNHERLASNFDTTSWYNFSAFELGRIESSPFDQGWGIYNMNTHDVTGDSLFILKLANGTMKKIAIMKRFASDYSFVFKIADLAKDAPAIEVTIAPGKTSTKNFIYYSVASNTTFDREPDKTEWDFVFTKWDSRIAGYPLVSGILSNENIESAKIAEADSIKPYMDVEFSKKISNIGFDWKHFNGASYDISNPYYYIHANDGKYYRIKFLSFDFMTGTTVFEKKLLN